MQVLVQQLTTLLFFAIFWGCALVPSVGADFLNDYFNDKVFGEDPGPCPNTSPGQADGCLIDLSTGEFPAGLGDAEFCLFDLGIFGPSGCAALEDWVESGTAEIFDMQCSNIGVSSISLTRNNGAQMISSRETDLTFRTSCSNVLVKLIW